MVTFTRTEALGSEGAKERGTDWEESKVDGEGISTYEMNFSSNFREI
jgi:hypothetical protein